MRRLARRAADAGLHAVKYEAFEAPVRRARKLRGSHRRAGDPGNRPNRGGLQCVRMDPPRRMADSGRIHFQQTEGEVKPEPCMPLRRFCPAIGGRTPASSDMFGHRQPSVRHVGRVRPSATERSPRRTRPAIDGRAFATPDAFGHRRSSVRHAGFVRSSTVERSPRRFCPANDGRAFATPDASGQRQSGVRHADFVRPSAAERPLCRTARHPLHNEPFHRRNDDHE